MLIIRLTKFCCIVFGAVGRGSIKILYDLHVIQYLHVAILPDADVRFASFLFSFLVFIDLLEEKEMLTKRSTF